MVHYKINIIWDTIFTYIWKYCGCPEHAIDFRWCNMVTAKRYKRYFHEPGGKYIELLMMNSFWIINTCSIFLSKTEHETCIVRVFSIRHNAIIFKVNWILRRDELIFSLSWTSFFVQINFGPLLLSSNRYRDNFFTRKGTLGKYDNSI